MDILDKMDKTDFVMEYVRQQSLLVAKPALESHVPDTTERTGAKRVESMKSKDGSLISGSLLKSGILSKRKRLDLINKQKLGSKTVEKLTKTLKKSKIVPHRKRSRRPPTSLPSCSPSSSPPKKKKNQLSKSYIPSRLIDSFKAPNVSSGRLTIAPSSNIGIFKKVKSSMHSVLESISEFTQTTRIKTLEKASKYFPVEANELKDQKVPLIVTSSEIEQSATVEIPGSKRIENEAIDCSSDNSNQISLKSQSIESEKLAFELDMLIRDHQQLSVISEENNIKDMWYKSEIIQPDPLHSEQLDLKFHDETNNQFSHSHQENFDISEFEYNSYEANDKVDGVDLFPKTPFPSTPFKWYKRHRLH